MAVGKKNVTINDIAKRGGVSKVTVSYVLNNRQTGVRISEATRTRVLSLAQEMGYHPNALARGLARRQTDTLALVMQYPAVFSGWSGFINELMHGASDAASALGYDLMLHTKAQVGIEREVAALTDGRVDGVLILRDRDDPLAERLSEAEFPFVQIFSRPRLPHAPFVDCDNVTGGRMATEHLIRLGHRRIGHIAGSQSSVAASHRFQGYCGALATHSLPFSPDWVCQVSYEGGDFAPLLAMMQRAKAPTALFAWSDDVAIKAMRLLRQELGKSVPGDVAIVGYDGTLICEHIQPALSSVRQPIYEMSGQAVRMLVDTIQGRPIETPHALFTPILDVRGSCGGFLT